MSTLIRLGLRNVRRNQRRTAITLAALAVGVGAMVAVAGLLAGLQRTMTQTVTRGITGAIQVHRPGHDASGGPPRAGQTIPAALLTVLREVPGVTAASGRLGVVGMLAAGDRSLFASLTGMDPANEQVVCSEMTQLLFPGSHFVGTAHPDGAVMTPALAHALGVQQGDVATVLVHHDEGLGAMDIHVDGTIALNLGGEQRFVLLPLAVAQELLRLPGELTEVVLAVEPIGEVEAVAARVRAAIGDDYEVTAWTELARSVRRSLHAEDVEARIIAVCFLFLMFLGVGNTMLMTIVERTGEIGTLLALGMRRRRIVAMLLVEAAAIGSLGALGGAVAGIAVVLALAQRGILISTAAFPLPFIVRPVVGVGDVASAAALAVGCTLAAALYPAWRATRLRPVLALGALR